MNLMLIIIVGVLCLIMALNLACFVMTFFIEEFDTGVALLGFTMITFLCCVALILVF